MARASLVLCLSALSYHALAFTPHATPRSTTSRRAMDAVQDEMSGTPPVVADEPKLTSILVDLKWYEATERTIDPRDMPGVLAPVSVPGENFWDPLGLTTSISDNQLRWYRAAEIKHGRVCMLAFTGWFYQSVCHLTFAGQISSSEGVSFADIDKLKFYEQWDAIPEFGRYQILAAIAAVEFSAEASGKPHYVFGNRAGCQEFWPFNAQFSKLQAKPAKLKAQQTKEIQNGRLAMLGVASLYAAHYFPGSVPVLPVPY